MKARAVGVCWNRLAETIQTDACSVGFMESYNKLHQRCIDILLTSTPEFPKACTLSEAQLWVYKVRRCTRDANTCYSDNDDSDACHSLGKFERIKHIKRCMCKVSKIVITENYRHRDSTGNVPVCIVGFFTERPNCIILVPIISSVVLLSLSFY